MTAILLRVRSLADSARVGAAAEAEAGQQAEVAGGPSAPAIVDGSIRWSWSDLDARADGVARRLVGAGVAAGDRVALLAPPSAAAVAVLHGVARVGAVAAPLGLGLTSPELAATAIVLRPRVVVADSGQLEAAQALGCPVIRLRDLVDSDTVNARSAPSSASVVAVPDDAPAVAILTSGTTGRPKIALLSSAALVASAEAWLAVLPPATGWLLAVGLGHIAGIGVIWRAALAGVPLVILDRPDAAAIVAALAGDPAPSHVSLVPTQLTRILDATSDGPPPPTLRAVPLGGGPISPELVLRALAAGWPVVPTYGLTEAASGVTALPTAEAAAHTDSAGRPLPGVEVRIDDPDDAGVGEIQVRSAARFTAYLDDPEATAAAFTGDRWLRTGDLGRLDAGGFLTIHDRRTDRIVRGGENIAPSEVEAVLLGHPAISDAGVVARRDPTYGHVPVAAIVLRAGAADPGDAELITRCQAHLARFKVPVAFVRLAALPRTASGKLQRGVLRDRLDDQAGPE